jgi:hypothetical protein
MLTMAAGILLAIVLLYLFSMLAAGTLGGFAMLLEGGWEQKAAVA